MNKQIATDVCQANIELQKQKLVTFSWGNVSGLDADEKIMYIKPSGVPYDELTPEMMVGVNMDGDVVYGKLKPSSDTPTHLELYRSFEVIGGVCHTHSPYATMWAQACKDLPCFGTTHADYFYGNVPVTPVMTSEEIKSDYELNTGKVIVQRFEKIDPLEMPAVLVANHAPFTWGLTPQKAVENAAVLEQCAFMASGTISIDSNQKAISQSLLDKHYLRKHGKSAYYGQS